MKERKWEIQTTHGIEIVEGVRILIAGYLDCIVNERYGGGYGFVVTELSCGCTCGSGDSIAGAIISAELRVEYNGKPQVHRALRQMYEKHGEVN